LFHFSRYCDPKYDFPPQEQVVTLAGELAEEQFMKYGDECLFVCGSYTIGELLL
jgi:hypothetical protein